MLDLTANTAFAGWDDITEVSGMAPNNAGVSMAWRHKEKNGRPRAEFTLNARLVADLGWQTECRVRIMTSPDRTRVALVPSPKGKKLMLRAKGGTLSQRLDWVTSGPQRAERATHRIEGGALVIDLPPWALAGTAAATQPKPAPTKAVPAKAPFVAKPPPASLSEVPQEDLVEAEALIRNGKGAQDIHDEFGWPLKAAQEFTIQVRAKIGGEKRVA